MAWHSVPIRAVTFSPTRVCDLCMYLGGDARGRFWKTQRTHGTCRVHDIRLTEQMVMYALPIRIEDQKPTAGSGFGGAHGSSLPSCTAFSMEDARPPGADHGPACPVRLGERVERGILVLSIESQEATILTRRLAASASPRPVCSAELSRVVCTSTACTSACHTPYMRLGHPQASTGAPGPWEFIFIYLFLSLPLPGS